MTDLLLLLAPAAPYLKALAWLTGGLFAIVWVFYVLYITIMAARDIRDTVGLDVVDKLFLYPALIIGFVWDVVFNLVIATVLFVQWPSRWNDTLSGRCKHNNRRRPVGALQRWQYLLGTWVLKRVAKWDKSGWHNPV
jgi:hypothetical protein